MFSLRRHVQTPAVSADALTETRVISPRQEIRQGVPNADLSARARRGRGWRRRFRGDEEICFFLSLPKRDKRAKMWGRRVRPTRGLVLNHLATAFISLGDLTRSAAFASCVRAFISDATISRFFTLQPLFFA